MGMDAALSCKTFEQIITALKWIAHNKGLCWSIVHKLDDFLFVGPTCEEVALNLRNFKEICTMIDIPLAAEKKFEPARVVDLMRITLDAERMEAHLPDDKIIKMGQLLEFQNKTTCILKKLHCLLVFLNFACSVIRPGRTSLRRLINHSIRVKELHHFVKINKEVQLDVLVWLECLSNFNGKAFFLYEEQVSSDVL